MKRVVVLSAAVVALAAGCGSTRHASSLPGLTAKRLAKLERLVESDAKGAGDAHPSSALVFASRRHKANIAAGAGTGVKGNTPVYLVVVHGNFVCSGCSVPAGAAAPRGDVITYIVDRATLRGLDFGIGGGQVDTSRLGPGLVLPLG